MIGLSESEGAAMRTESTKLPPQIRPLKMAQNPIRQILAFAETKPLATAVVGTRLNLNYKTFASTVLRFAAQLRAEGVRPGHVVGLRLRAELQAVAVAAVMHEAATSFAATRPIIDGYEREIDFVITEDSGWLASPAKAIVVNADWLASLGAINHQIEPMDFDSAQSLALLVFSSGTTGVPKGVEFSIDDIRRRTAAAEKNWMPFHPFFAELGLDTVSGIQAYLWSLINGETYFLSGTSADNLQLISDNAIQSIKTSPSKLADLVAAAVAANTRLDGLKEVQVAGGLLSPKTARALAVISTAKLQYLYGSTEAGTVTKGAYQVADPECVGQVVSEAEVKITDDDGKTLPNGTGGCLNLRTPYQAKGYWQTRENTKTGFQFGWFMPGDTAILSETGQLTVTGRIDELINAAGIKLNPAVIDAKLLGYRGIQDLASFGYLEPGAVHKQLGVAIVTNEPISIEQFQHRLKEAVPETNQIVIMNVAEIPRNALGKPLRRQLAQAYESELENNEN